MKKQAPAKPSMAPAVITLREVADYLRVHPSTIYRLLKRRQISGFRIDGEWRFHVKTIDEWRSRMETRLSSRGSRKRAGNLSADTSPDRGVHTGV
jgi:excisionase family DNA binding protein